ncbi:uncharacterized protein A1O5_05368 [Cladophialophora psammophila CBS 110553]|uniref:NACHT domain-containing protein n=1 Tax=Cladophialophora psammophila CBS 110553 TaxID=1182543 RepID=W9X2L9_9EURO|nr:uncharacterized protein A1O5_05368 [Cladophialophora psammophila CBS 110553]EXJ71560.1 hypothetical protein A1O5_05368 [Cladophialophora psammophila CBS 110553]
MALDPLSAVGLAANIVQFIDLICELISGAQEIYHSADGATAGNVELEGLAESIPSLSSKLMKPLDPTQSAVSTAEEEIVKVAASSRAVGEELVATIQSFKVGEGSHKKWQSFRQALNTTWKRDQIDLIGLSVRQGQVLQSLENARTECLEIDSARLQRIEPMLESVRGLVRGSQDLTEQHLAGIDQNLRDSDHEATKFQKEASILKSLSFDRMAARYSAITEAHQKTFKWIFEPSCWQSSDPRSRIRFHDWLTSGNGISWISGKPGSGKSTLMKYLRDCQQTKRCLQVWANNDRLTIAGFFWIAGSDMQKSQRAQERWAISRHGLQSEWSFSELIETFRKLSVTTVDPENPAKFCIFIDGLDEYNGDHLDLIKTVQNIAQINNVKVCVASRPWNCFEDAFGRDSLSKLCLQDLTKDDIALYAREKLEEDPNFSLTRQDVLQTEQLISEIVHRPKGSVDKVYRKRMAHTFRVALETHKPLRLLLYSSIDEGDHVLMRHPTQSHSGSIQRNDKILIVEDVMNRQLNGRYKGYWNPTANQESEMSTSFIGPFNAAACVCSAFIRQGETFPGSLDLVHLDDFIKFARRAEDELVDEMNIVFYSSAPMLRDNLDICDGKATSLLGKAIESGYISWIRDRLKKEPTIILGRSGQAWMITFLRWLSGHRDPHIQKASYEMAALLLRNGTNPNGMFDGKSILHTRLDNVGHKSNSPLHDSPLRKWYLELLLLLLKKGAKFFEDLANESCVL